MLSHLAYCCAALLVLVPLRSSWALVSAPRPLRLPTRRAQSPFDPSAESIAEIESAVVEDWRQTQEAPASERIRRLERLAGGTGDDDDPHSQLAALIRAAPVDEAMISHDWARLRLECAYMNSPESLVAVHDALRVAHAAHAGQARKSGEPYIVHPVAVASLLASLEMDVDAVVAGLLHDTVEDTPVTFAQLEARYGASVRSIVEGETKVSKLPKLALRSEVAEGAQIDEQAENLRQMFIAMTDDFRIIIVKLADRLHNMRTLEHMPEKKRLKIARETLEIFAPLAHRLGIWQFKSELEDTAFRYAHARQHAALSAALETRRARYGSALAGSKAALERVLESDETLKGVRIQIVGREKELYSLWLKLTRDALRAAQTPADEESGMSVEAVSGCTDYSLADPLVFDVDGVQDVIALRVVLDVPRLDAEESLDAWRERSVWLCYHALGLVQRLEDCEAVPRVKDYISFPKPNGYQSLHASVVRLPENQIVEIQIRTAWMHSIAEHGVAAHWLYKDSVKSQHSTLPERAHAGANVALGGKPYALAWLESIKTWQHEIHSSREFIETIRRELLGKRVFVFLRDGKILDLSRGATVLDAAFHIHTDVGLHMAEAYINGREVEYSYELQNGDVVSIVTGDGARPKVDWMRAANRRSTKNKLRAYFKANARDDFEDRNAR